MTIRPIRPEDEPLLVQVPRDALRPQRLSALPAPDDASGARHPRAPGAHLHIDYDREIALVAEKDEATGRTSWVLPA